MKKRYFCLRGVGKRGIKVWVMKKYLGWLYFLLLFVGGVCMQPAAMGQKRTQPDQRLEHVAMLAREVYWPNLKRQPQFFIEYVGTPSDFSDKFTQYFQKHKVRGKSVQVTLTTNWESRNKILYPNLIFVSSSAMVYMPKISKFFENYPVLIVSEQPYFGKGWMAALMPQEMDPDGMVHEWSFTIDPTNIKTYSGLSVSAKLAPRNGSPRQNVTLEVQTTVAKPPLQEKPVDYVSLLRERNEVIAQHEATIVLLEDTIIQQREAIDSLSYNLSLARYGMWDGIRQGLLWGSWTSDSTRPVVSEAPSVETTRERVNTAPWETNSMGLTIFFVLGLVSVSSVLLLSGSSATTPAPTASGMSRGAELAAVGTMAAAAGREKRTMEESFLGNVSHELRTPLNAIVGLSQYVATSQNVDAEVRESLEIINSNAHGLMQMMNNILMLAMLERKEVVLNLQIVDLSVLLADLYESMRSYIQSLKRTDELMMHHTSQHSGEVLISCDVEKLRMVFELLLSLSMVNTRVRSLAFGGVIKSDEECVLYVRASDAETTKEVQPADFLFDSAHTYSKDSAHSEISLDTAQGLLSLMGAQLYLAIGRVEQMYYFCLPNQNSLS